MNPYNILGVEDNSSEEVCKKAYRKLCARYHPDSSTGDREKFDEVQKAWGMLHSKDSSSPILNMRKVYMSHVDLFNFCFKYV